MRDIFYKNLTSEDKKRKVISTSEISDSEGVRSTIRRHFACVVREIKDTNIVLSAPSLYVLKEQNHDQLRERFSCRLKGSVLLKNQDKLYAVLYLHSLHITLTPTPIESNSY